MTPEALTAIALVLMDLRDWLYSKDPGSLDAALVDSVIDAVGRARDAEILGGAK